MNTDIIQQFKALRGEHVYWSTWTCFTQAVKGKELNEKDLRELFYKLVSRQDYLESNEEELIEYLLKLVK